MKIKVSTAEIIDKYTILQLKLERIRKKKQLNNIRNEWEVLTPVVDSIYAKLGANQADTLSHLHDELYNVNATLWNIEDQLREMEKAQTFGPDFVELARSVYYNNDERAAIKSLINGITNSNLVEEKSYRAY